MCVLNVQILVVISHLSYILRSVTVQYRCVFYVGVVAESLVRTNGTRQKNTRWDVM